MKTDKNSKMSLEQFRGVFLKLGLVISLSVVLVAFEWATSEVNYNINTEYHVSGEIEEAPPITRDKPIIEKPIPQKQLVQELLIADDNTEIEDEFDIIDAEVDQTDAVEMVELTKEVEEQVPVFIAQEMPKFPGGEKSLGKFLQKNMKYPEQARENGIEGKVFVRFVVGADGTVKKAEIARGVDPLLDDEAIRVVKQMPRWRPGSNRGKTVPVWFTLPINFRLN